MSERTQDPNAFLGVGWSFPPTFSDEGARVDTVSGVDDVHRALRILFGTMPGERIFQGRFGCDMRGLLFEPIDQELLQSLERRIRAAVLQYEPRVVLERVDIQRSDNDAATLVVSLHYLVKRTNSRFNMVFPFSVNEALPRLGG